MPIRFILQRLRRRQRDEDNTPRRTSAQDRRLSAAQRDQLSWQAEYEARKTAWTLEQQRIRAERRTPEWQKNNFPFPKSGAYPERRTRRPSGSLLSTEAPVATPVATPIAIEPAIKDASSKVPRRSLKRARNREDQSFKPVQGPHTKDHLFATASRSLKRARKEEHQIERLQVSRSKAYQTVSVQASRPEMKGPSGPNRFEAAFKRSPLAYSERHAASGIRLKPIGTKLGDPDPETYLFGGFEFEKPIEVTPSAPPAPSKQTQVEVEFQSSECTNAETLTSECKESESESRLASAEVCEPQISEHKETQPENEANSVEPQVPERREGENEDIATPALVHDPRWSNELPLHMFFPEDFGFGDSTQEENIDTAEQEAASSERPKWSATQWLFGSSRRKVRPPIIKPRLVPSAQYQRALQQQPVASTLTQNDVTDTKRHLESVASSAAIKEDGIAKPQNSPSHVVAESTKVEEVDVKSEAANIIEDGIAATEPVTPLKVIAKKPAEQDMETQSANIVDYKIETPADKLAKLDIQDYQEDDTPKATPHAGTRTTRVTRYREALEKAQKAKLEQYELVRVSDDWDQKVRSAVRNGIPDYLGPHDLARVVPQYSKNIGQDNWLNDETINKYLEIIAAHGRKNDRPDQVRSHHAFNNFFYNNLASKGAASVVKWSKRAKIGGKSLAYVEKVFVPINSGAHWTLAVVEPTLKKITHYNSMRGSGIGTKACKDLKEWVAVELGKDFKEEEWTLLAVGESPQQTNSDDCGIFTITSARQIMLGYAPMSYRASQIPDQRIRIVAELINRGLLRSAADL